ncbi:hypothetical protein KA025_00440 [Candidatus Saccharibacteria bacterium]|nr:hypothetical protein [Candidatus Saccharibacteria bacterium]
MKNDAKTKPNSPKPVVVTVSTADFKKKGRAGLTLREYKELSAKDRSTLTKNQQEQLAQAHEQLHKMAESITSQYDFSAMTKAIEGIYKMSPAFQTLQAIDTSPMLKIVADMQKTTLALQPALDRVLGIQATITPAIEAIQKSSLFTQNQFTALAAIQKSLVAFPSESIIASIKGIQDAFQAPLIARTMFADFRSAHERILRNLRFDIGSLTTSIEFSRFETVDFAIDDVTTDKDDLTANAIATQTNSIGNVTFTDSASLLLAFNDLKQEVRELRQQLLAKDNQQGITQTFHDEIATELEKKQQELNDRLKLLTSDNKDFQVTASYLLDLAQRAEQLFNESDEGLRQKLLEYVLSNIELKDKKLSYILNDPFKTIVEAKKKSLSAHNSDIWCG